MRIRIVPSSKGVKGVDWERIYLVQAKSFLIWKKIIEFKTMEEAFQAMKIYKPQSIEWKVY